MDSRMQLTSIDVIASALEPVIPSLDQLSSPDGAVTLMLSDIANAGAAAEQLGPERWERLLGDHRLLVEQTVTHHDGQVVKSQHDGFCASFNSAHAGLHAAVEL
jgi:class 3 adenylate cyclase